MVFADCWRAGRDVTQNAYDKTWKERVEAVSVAAGTGLKRSAINGFPLAPLRRR